MGVGLKTAYKWVKNIAPWRKYVNACNLFVGICNDEIGGKKEEF